MTMTYRIHSICLASLCSIPLLTACPGGTGDLGGEEGPGESSSTGQPGTEDSSGSPTSGPTSGPTTTVGSGEDSSGGSGSTGSGDECTEEECGPAPGAPNFLCQDGVTWGGPGPCERGPDGTCGWTFVECPACCYAPEEPTDCIEGATCCADGTWACNEGDGMPTCEVGSVCACCYLGDQPDCIEGATCCGGGVWQCNDDGGAPTCEGGDIGVECELPPPKNCCDPLDEPVCIEGATCCADGTWECNDLGMAPCDAGEVCDDGMCQIQGETCAGGEACCAGLDCCEGVPVPPGQEFCSNMCPISDRNRKENFAEVDAQAILAKLVEIPITTWNYTFEDPSIRHVGPMAQDFKAAFEVGATDKMIFQIDADGVALVSIQALHGQVDALRKENAALEQALASMQARLDRLEGKRSGKAR